MRKVDVVHKTQRIWNKMKKNKFVDWSIPVDVASPHQMANNHTASRLILDFLSTRPSSIEWTAITSSHRVEREAKICLHKRRSGIWRKLGKGQNGKKLNRKRFSFPYLFAVTSSISDRRWHRFRLCMLCDCVAYAKNFGRHSWCHTQWGDSRDARARWAEWCRRRDPNVPLFGCARDTYQCNLNVL